MPLCLSNADGGHVRSLPSIECILVGAKDPVSIKLQAELLGQAKLSARQLLELLDQLGKDNGL